VDSVLFITLAFYGILPVWVLIKGQYLVKMAITLLSLPLIYLIRSEKTGREPVPVSGPDLSTSTADR
jgi:uncharacterized PurR-regulated membrane protein YhhQ (DUF165 family)